MSEELKKDGLACSSGTKALFHAIHGSRTALEAACRAIDVPKGSLCEESIILAGRFREMSNKVSAALTACLDAEVSLRSFVSVFGDDILLCEGGGRR